MEIQRRLEEIRQNGYEFKFGEYINSGFNIFGRQAGIFIGFTVIVFLIGLVSSLIPIIGGIGYQFVLAQPLLVGFILVSYAIILGKNVSFNDAFGGFKMLGQLVLWALLSFGIQIVVILPIILLTGTFGPIISVYGDIFSGRTPDPQASLLLFKSMIVAISIIIMVMLVIYTFLTFTLHFICIAKLDVISALKASITVVRKNFFSVLLMWIVLGLFVVIGAIPCGLGLLVAFPLIYTVNTAAFMDILKISEEGSTSTFRSNEGLLDS